MMLSLVLVLALGIFVRRAVVQLPEMETVAWVLVILGVIVVAALQGRLTVLDLP